MDSDPGRLETSPGKAVRPGTDRVSIRQLLSAGPSLFPSLLTVYRAPFNTMTGSSPPVRNHPPIAYVRPFIPYNPLRQPVTRRSNGLVVSTKATPPSSNESTRNRNHNRFSYDPDGPHTLVTVHGRKWRCKFCYAQRGTTGRIRYSSRRCRECDVSLCVDCFSPFHEAMNRVHGDVNMFRDMMARRPSLTAADEEDDLEFCNPLEPPLKEHAELLLHPQQILMMQDKPANS